ncbi:alpha/beta hydrolase [Massilia sp. Mn16-1_5]|uniref:alpha/beta hydrolase n=1 Tax=Massilia sp. Mn16-1_5 TaxID=2079199 RepID=UPI00109EB9B4|nr:alpha/beta hydrolase [Massilia sp. Mn16-1_5]THC46096.1 esterase [Massilia sp. Mn16-1_5]
MKKLIYGASVLLAGALAACSPLAVVNAVSPGGAVQATSALRYGPDPRNMLDVYRPAGNAVDAPVVVFFYGGNWVSGKRADYAFVGRALAARGFVVVIPDYRLYPQVRYPDFLVDGAAAVTWTVREIRAHGGDPMKVFLMGHSAGAYNAAMLALDPRWLEQQGMTRSMLRGWIGLAGPYDFLPVQNPVTRPVFSAPDTPPDSQPLAHVSTLAPPALLIAASKDKLVDPARNTGGMAAKLRAYHVPVRELYVDGVSHATLVASLSNSLKGLAPTLDAVETFIRSEGGR